MLLCGRKRAVVLSLPGWTPGQPTLQLDPLEVSGIRALLGALGHPDPGGFDLDDPDPEVLQHAPAPVVPAILAVLLALPLVTVVLGPPLRHRISRRTQGPATAEPGLWKAAGGRQRIAVTDDGAALLIVDPDGTATAVPGPALGGAVNLFVLAAEDTRPTRTALVTAAGAVLVVLPAAWWPSVEDALHAQALLCDAGLRRSTQRVPQGSVQPPGPSRGSSPSVHEIAHLTSAFAAILCLASVLSGARTASVITGSTVVLAVVVPARERRRLR